MKKPVDLGFLDFSTRKARHDACHREVALNRRLAPDVYLGVADVLAPDGSPAEHLVVMRRLPEERRLSALVAAGDDCDGHLRDIARIVAAFHAAEPPLDAADPLAAAATPDAVRRNWEDNVAVIAAHPEIIEPDQARHVQDLAARFLAGRAPLLTRRLADGLVRDGHGDLLADDIFCLDDGPRILDCLDFADRYRIGDVLLDVAFLAMDIERLGHPELAASFLATYAEHADEHHPATLAHHFIAYRAHVRAKVACVRHDQGEPGAAADARALHDLARRHLEQGRVVLALVGGLPGSGKSTLAARLAEDRDWAVLRTDAIRKELAGLPPTADASAPPGQGLYEPAAVARVYDEMLRRARTLLDQGVPVLLDATFASADRREEARALAGATVSDLVELRCVAPDQAERARVAGRHLDASDATPAVHDAMAATFDAWPEAAAIDTGGEVRATVAAAEHAIEQQLAADPARGDADAAGSPPPTPS